MANLDSNSSSADFFKLPREMRDEIYSNLTKDVVIVEGVAKREQGKLKVTVKKAPMPNLARVSKQFKEEYERQNRPRRILSFKDLGGPLSDRKGVPDLTLYGTFRAISSDLLAICSNDGCTASDCLATLDVSEHAAWLQEIQDTLSSPAELTVRLCVQWRPGAQLSWVDVGHGSDFSAKLNSFVEIVGLSRLEVYPFYWQDKYNRPGMCAQIFEDHENMVALWTKEEGWKEI